MSTKHPASRSFWIVVAAMGAVFASAFVFDRYLDGRLDDVSLVFSREGLHVDKATAIRRDARKAYVLMLEGWLSSGGAGSRLGTIQDAVDVVTRESVSIAELAPLDAAEQPLLLKLTEDLASFSSTVLLASVSGVGPGRAPDVERAMAQVDWDVAAILAHAAGASEEASRELGSLRRRRTGLQWTFLCTVVVTIGASLSRQRRMRERAMVAELDRLQHERAARTQSQFFAAVSHELRTPLVAIRGFASDVEERPGADEVIRERARRIQEEAFGLLGMINNILDSAKIESGQVELHIEDVSLSKVVDRCVSRCQGLLRDKPVEIEVKIPEGAPAARADFVKLQQVFTNLIANAIKFTERGRIEVRLVTLGVPDDRVVIEVEDTGVGMVPEALTRIWKPFQQADATISRVHGGTGLGLSIVRGIVLLHGGEVDVRSTLGTGSTFTVSLPRASSPDRGPPELGA